VFGGDCYRRLAHHDALVVTHPREAGVGEHLDNRLIFFMLKYFYDPVRSRDRNLKINKNMKSSIEKINNIKCQTRELIAICF